MSLQPLKIWYAALKSKLHPGKVRLIEPPYGSIFINLMNFEEFENDAGPVKSLVIYNFGVILH